MKWIDDPSGRFAARPFYEPAELDALGSSLAAEAARRRGGRRFRPPLDTDALLVLLEVHVDDLDLFADLEPAFGPGVEAVTEFHAGRLPVVRVERRLAADPRRHLRLRFTLAHELGHVVLHRDLWERRFAQPSLFPGRTPGSEAAHRRPAAAGGEGGGARGGLLPGTGRVAGGAPGAGWLEWQAAYVAAALLMPASALASCLGVAPRPRAAGGRDRRPFAGTPDGDRLVDRAARAFRVSAEAAAVRLGQLGWLRDPAEAGQRSLWIG